MRAVLQFLASHFVLRSKDLARLIRKRTPNKNDIRTINRSLKLLAECGLVHRLKYLDLENDGVGYACGLTDKGVAEYGGKTFDEHSERTLDHELEISHFHIALQKLCDDQALKLLWRQVDLKHGVNPDAYFSLSNPAKEGKNTNHFFLEVERAKVGNYKNGVPSIIRKLRGYYEYYNSNECESAWGFRTYRVLTILRSEERAANLIKSLQDSFNHRMFFVTTEPRYRTAITAPIFFTPKDSAVSLLDL